MVPKIEDTFAEKTRDIEEGSVEKPSAHENIKGWAKSRFWAVETSGIQRVTDADRLENTTHVWNACTFWYVT